MTDAREHSEPTTKDVVEEEARHIGETARQEAGRIMDGAKDQGRELYAEARSRAKEEANHQTDRAADGLRAVSSDLRRLSQNEETKTSLATWMQQGADQIDGLASRVNDRGFDGLVEDVRGFARRNPGTFLGISFGIGLLAGRLARNTEMGDPDGVGMAGGDAMSTSFDEGFMETSRRPARDPSLSQSGTTTRPGGAG